VPKYPQMLKSFDTLAGTPSEVCQDLTYSQANRVIALTFTHENEQVVDAIASALTIDPAS